ncbi:MAG: aspartate-semialdehyde dehydrogenase [Acidimicrobiia bacterium]|nr:MAG: aspartate-semialdehyde dehydrogenase [Acidimicrobiia bacterium]
MKTFSSPSVAIVGATGAVGTTMLSILEERSFPVSDLRLMASSRSVGRIIETKWGSIEVEDLDSVDPSGVDVALFSAGGSRSLRYAPDFATAGATVIDNSSAFRMDETVPLVVAQVNDEAIRSHVGIVANPNCTTMVVMMAAGPLHAAAGLRTMFATSYQSVSGSGRTGIALLAMEIDHFGSNREGLVSGSWEEPDGDLYARPIGYNVLPLAGTITEAGYTDEEWKLVNESRKILDRDDIAVEPTCVRVPVMVGHGISVSMWFDRRVDLDEAVAVLGSAPGMQLWDDTKVPTPLDSAGIDDVLVGRLRETIGFPGGISLFAIGDNLRKGAALNAVQLAELLLE